MKKTVIIIMMLSIISFVSASNSVVNSMEIDTNNLNALLESGSEELQKGNAEKAVTSCFDPIIKQYESAYSKEKRKIYCARTPQESLFYMFMASSKSKEAIVIDSTWAQAYFLKGYANIDLGKLDEAKKWINRAITLSPMNSSYLSELGHIYQAEKKWSKSIKIFESALEPAYSTSPESMKNSELLRAKRGIAYSLVELGKLDEAEKQYQECLSLDPNDEKSKQEIEYIKSIKSKKNSE